MSRRSSRHVPPHVPMPPPAASVGSGSFRSSRYVPPHVPMPPPAGSVRSAGSRNGGLGGRSLAGSFAGSFAGSAAGSVRSGGSAGIGSNLRFNTTVARPTFAPIARGVIDSDASASGSVFSGGATRNYNGPADWRKQTGSKVYGWARNKGDHNPFNYRIAVDKSLKGDPRLGGLDRLPPRRK